MMQASMKLTKDTLPDWEKLNREWEESGLTRKAFCESRNIKLSNFIYNRSKILENKSIENSSKFRQLKVKNDTLNLPCQNLVIHFTDNIRLSIPPNFSSHQIKTVLLALGVQEC